MTPAAATERLHRRNEALQSKNAELRSANEALVLAGARYLVLHDLAPTPLVTLDEAGQITDLNRAAETMLASTRAQLLGTHFPSLFDASHAVQLAGLFAAEGVHGLEISLDRHGVHLELLIDAVVLPGMSPARAVLACVDVTMRQLAIKRAYEAHRLESLGVLAGGVAHDFNNLMTVVLSGTDHVLSELAAGSSHVEPLTEVRQAALRAGALAHQMLAYSGRVSVPVHPVELTALIRELEPLLRASTHATRVHLDLVDGLPMVAGDTMQLRQVLLDLAINGSEAMLDRGGQITIAVRATEPQSDGRVCIRVEVRDEGAGMSPTTQARIFDPYFSTKSAGRGLGLAVVHGVVRAHGGSMSVASEIGVGSCVAFQLPSIAAQPTAVTAPVLPGWQGRGTVLVVDDDETVRRVLKRALTRLGFTVQLTSGGAEALVVLRETVQPIQLVITDLTMPEMSGVAFARVVRAEFPAIPIVLLTGYGELPADGAALFTAALAKPFEVTSLADVLRAALARESV